MRWLPLGGVLATLAIAPLWRPWLQRRRYGTRGAWLARMSQGLDARSVEADREARRVVDAAGPSAVIQAVASKAEAFGSTRVS